MESDNGEKNISSINYPADAMATSIIWLVEYDEKRGIELIRDADYIEEKPYKTISMTEEYETKMYEYEGDVFKYKYYMYDKANEILIQDQQFSEGGLFSSTSHTYNLIDLKNKTKINLECEELRTYDDELIVLESGKIPYYGEEDNGYFETIVNSDLTIEINKVSIGKEYRIDSEVGEYYIIENVGAYSYFFVNKQLQRVSQIYDSIEYKDDLFLVSQETEDKVGFKFINKNLQDVSKEYQQIYPTNNAKIFYAATDEDIIKDTIEISGKLINIQGKEINGKEYKGFVYPNFPTYSH